MSLEATPNKKQTEKREKLQSSKMEIKSKSKEERKKKKKRKSDIKWMKTRQISRQAS